MSRVAKSARRCLFGRPTPEQQEATRLMLQTALDDIYKKDCEKWNFDFRLGVPIEDEASCSLYAYDAVNEAEVPEYYRAKRLSIASTSSTDSNTSSASSSPVYEKDESLMSLSCPESDISMEFEPIPASNRTNQTPKKRLNKLTDYLPIRRRKTQKSPKEKSPARLVRSPRRCAATTSASRHF